MCVCGCHGAAVSESKQWDEKIGEGEGEEKKKKILFYMFLKMFYLPGDDSRTSQDDWLVYNSAVKSSQLSAARRSGRRFVSRFTLAEDERSTRRPQRFSTPVLLLYIHY